MKRALLLSLILPGMLAFGCQENPTATSPYALRSPDSLQAASINDSTVRLQWIPSENNVPGYLISWRGENQQDTGGVELGAETSVEISSLHSRQPYTFVVSAKRGSERSAPASIQWAGATRYEQEPGDSVSIRIYELGSVYGSGLILDPALGGPKRVNLLKPPYTPVQLAILLRTDSLDIGPAFAFVNVLGTITDSSVYISKRAFTANDLDNWYYGGSIEDEIPSDGHLRYFRFPMDLSQGQGFFVRTGAAGSYHYARVLVKSINGELVQGYAPNRYVELAISYQQSAGVPYARVGGGKSSISEGSRSQH